MRRGPGPALAEERQISMEEAVGYRAIDCTHMAPPDSTLVLKHNRLFLVMTARAEIVPPGHCSLGLFLDDTRILSHYALRVRGGPPAFLSADAPRSYTGQVDLAVSDLPFGGDPWDPKHAIHLQRELLLSDRLVERLTITSYLKQPLDYWVELALGCDFADIFEVRGWRRPLRGQFYAAQVEPSELAFQYRGRDGQLLRSLVRFRTSPDRLGSNGARWAFTLAQHTPVVLEWEIGTESVTGGSPKRKLEEHRTELDSGDDEWQQRCSQWTSDLPGFDLTLRRGMDDLGALYIEVDGAEIVSAGIPWYSTVFGRDAIIASLETMSVNHQIAVDTLHYLARRQGSKNDPATDEEPGKIMHELRRGEMARNREIPHVPYYGTVDATPLWLVLLHETWRWTGDFNLVRALLPHAEQAMAWIDHYGDRDGDGLVEYAPRAPKGLVNQGWKDSGDGVPFPEGDPAQPPIALIEVQGYVYDAKTRMADLFRSLGEAHRAEELVDQAERLRSRVLGSFWLEEAGHFALALDGSKQVVPTLTSNAGHLLWSRLPTPEQAGRLADHLLGPNLFSGWGIRTLSAAHRAFNPMSYHNGSIWPHDNALIVLGLAHYGRGRSALPIVEAIYEAAMRSDLHRLPELFCGLARQPGIRPIRYPVSCSPQAWAAGAPFMLMQALLGLFPDAPARVLHVRNPCLPGFINELSVSGLQIGGSRVALQFRRHRDRTLANLLSIEGEPLQVRIELA
jgi:glycogen debranching enzyme